MAIQSKAEWPIGKEHDMTTHVKARYANGVLTPLEPLDLEEGAEVTVLVEEGQADGANAPASK